MIASSSRSLGAMMAGRILPAMVGAAVLVAASTLDARADTVEGALALAYRNNPQLNAQRAGTRATDENVGIALSGYRPKVTANGQIGEQYLDTLTKSPTGTGYTRSSGLAAVPGYGITASQTLLDGFQTANKTRQAEGQVLAARATLRNVEQSVLLAAVTAYMNLLRDGAILELQRNNVNVLDTTLRQTRDRFQVGEVTRTDVAQAESSLAAGRSQLLAAQSNYVTSKAAYVQVIGVQPGKLSNAAPVDRFSPPNLKGALARGAQENPAITTAAFNVDVATEQVKIAEGALYPTFSVNANVQKTYGSMTTTQAIEGTSASVIGALSVPIYQGGAEYATIRQAKETLGQQQLNLDVARQAVQQNVVQSWGQLDAAKAQIEATNAQVASAELALDGVRQEARVGQRTTLDVLNAQQALVNARVALVTAQHDRIVASYTLLSAVGSLSPQVLGLKIETYDATVHYQQVRDKWIGVRTPDGR